jgi:pimeloyl-ACP methyl ester carboxylesterase
VVRDACAGPGEVVLVGFSMGSLIAYNVVAHADETSPVKSLVTCGSPIGDPGFLKYVTQVAPKQTLAFPNGLRMWVNIWNDDDPATQVHELTPLFPDLRKEPEKPLREIQATPTRGRGPGPLNPAAAHNGPDYLSSKALGAAVKAALLAAGSGRAPV